MKIKRTFFTGRVLVMCTGLLLWSGLLTVVAQTVEEDLQQIMDDYEAVGLAVAVVKDNAVVYTNSLGWKELDNEIPLAKDDIFRIASISKSFSVTSILQLVEQGKLSLDDDVSDLIGFPVRNPAYPDQVITLKMLMNHTSSITDAQRYSSLDIINPEVNETWQKSYADYAPGEQYQYSNMGYNMIGTIIERVSGQRFDQYVIEHVLDPLGLYGGYASDLLDADRFAQIYRYDSDKGIYMQSERAYRLLGERLEKYEMGYDTPMFSPTGGMKISAPDLARYMMMHMNEGMLDGRQIITAEHAKMMQKPMVRVNEDADYGLGIRTERSVVPGVSLTGHTGSAYGLFSAMFFDAKQKYGLIAITNGAKQNIVRIEAIRVLYNHFIEK